MKNGQVARREVVLLRREGKTSEGAVTLIFRQVRKISHTVSVAPALKDLKYHASAQP